MNPATKRFSFVGGMVAVIALILVSTSFVGWGNSPSMAWGFGWMWLMLLMMVPFWGLAIWVVVALVRGLSRASPPQSSLGQQDSAMDILKRRYAQGEIDQEEYEQKKQDLI